MIYLLSNTFEIILNSSKRFDLENLLKYEKSPYLKQHENNPVHWYPWRDASLKKAKELKKPINSSRQEREYKLNTMRAIIYLNFHIAHFLLFSASTYVGCTIWLNYPVF